MVERQDKYWVPECTRAYLREAGYSTRALEDMEPHVREWNSWMRAVGKFYDYHDADGFGRVYQVHRHTIMPAMRREGAGLPAPGREDRCGARGPQSWGAEGARECAFVTRCFSRGALLDRLQMHVMGDDGAFRIRTGSTTTPDAR